MYYFIILRSEFTKMVMNDELENVNFVAGGCLVDGCVPFGIAHLDARRLIEK
jgi:hypothetical protein